MKRILLLTFIAVCISVIIPCKIYADVSIGATAWYANWILDGEKIDPTFLYGPALSIKLNDTFNLTFVYLYGKYDVYDGSMTRNDADLVLNCRLNDYFKIYGGMKLIYLSGQEGFWHYGAGPGLGLTFILPIVENLFFITNFGGFYLFGGEWSNDTDLYGCNDYGINTSAALAYYINPVTLNLGYRFQTVESSYKDYDSTKHKFHGVTLTVTLSF
jgi:hypothetical protein